MLNNLLKSSDLSEGGVRVIMIYPMNALVKDQLERIVNMLSVKNPKITVGMYTGQTAELEPREPKGMASWEEKGWDRPHRSGCYYYSREKIRSTPPHILITNYSMLEYMLLRSADSGIFEKKKLQAIILDEAHLYSGLLGNDINMLIKRLLLRMDQKHEDIRFYATSATIGDGKKETLQKAAAALFGVDKDTVEPILGGRQLPNKLEETATVPFVKNAFDGTDPDEARKRIIEIRNRIIEPDAGYFCQVNFKDLEYFQKLPHEDPQEDRDHFFPYKLHTFFDSPREFYSDMAITADSPLGNLQNCPAFGDNVTGLHIFTLNSQHRKDFYFKGKCCEDTETGKYRIFSSESLQEGFVVYFRLCAPQEKGKVRGFNLELSENKSCWNIVEENSDPAFVFALKQDTLSKPVSFDFLKTSASEGEWHSFEDRKISEFSGNMDDAESNDALKDSYNTTKTMLMPLGFVPRKLRALILAELLMPHLPPAGNEADNGKSWGGRQMLFFSDSRSGAAEIAENTQTNHNKNLIMSYIYQLIKGAPQKITDIIDKINDNNAVNQFHLPQYIISSHKEDDIVEFKKDLFIPALIFQSIAYKNSGGRGLESLGLLKCEPVLPQTDNSCYSSDSDKWINLLGVIPGIDAAAKKNFWRDQLFPEVIQCFRETRHVFWQTFEEVFTENADARTRTIRTKWYHKPGDSKQKEAYLENLRWKRDILRNALGFVTADLQKKAFVGKEQLKGSDILQEWVKKRFSEPGKSLELQKVQGIIERIFDFLVTCSYEEGNQCCLFRRRMIENEEGNGTYRAISLNPECLSFSQASEAYHANPETNKKVSAGEGRDVSGYLAESFDYKSIITPENFTESDDGTSFTSAPWGGLRVPEHSAQLADKDLTAVEKAFKEEHEINIISCTPTMEVGVDIGGLSSVLQTNLPPEKSNYVQRAGRAGRRGDPSALIVTFVGTSLFDTVVRQNSEFVFNRPNVFSNADVNFDGSREQIKQHVFQFLLGQYYQLLKDKINARSENNPIKAWDYTGNFLCNKANLEACRDKLTWANPDDDTETENNGITLPAIDEAALPLCNNLEKSLSKEDKTKEAYNQLVANTCLESEPFEGILRELQIKINLLSDEFNGTIDALFRAAEEKYQGALSRQTAVIRNAIVCQIKHMVKDPLITFLIHKRILPSYGFPVDVISFYSSHGHSQEREHFTALSEFMPESALTVAHKKVTVDALSYNVYDPNGSFKTMLLATCPICEHSFICEQAVGKIICEECGKEFMGFPVNDETNVEINNNTINHDRNQRLEEGEEDDICPPSDNVIPQGHIIRFIVPQGYRSNHEPQEASTCRRGRIWVNTEPKLLLGSQTIRLKTGNKSANKVRFLYEENVTALSINRGRYGRRGRGFIINQRTGELISKRFTDKENSDWKKSFEPDDTSFVYGNLAVETKVCTAICPIPVSASDPVLRDRPSLSQLIAIALLKSAATYLSIDERTLQICVRKNGDGNQVRTILFCIYDMSGKAGNIKLIQENGEMILKMALEDIKACTDRQHCLPLLSYNSARALANMTNEDFQVAKTWCEENESLLLSGESYKCNGKEAERATKVWSTFNSNSRPVTLLMKNATPIDFADGSLLKTLCCKNNGQSYDINVYFSKKKIQDKSEFTRQIIEYELDSAIWNFKELFKNVKFYEVDFEANEWKDIYDVSGIRFCLCGSWYLTDTMQNDSCLAEKDISEQTWYCCKEEITIPPAAEIKQPTPPKYTAEKTIIIPHNKPYYDFPVKEILKKLELQFNNCTIKKIVYNDRYFLTTKCWKFLYLLLKQMPLTSETDIQITARTSTNLDNGTALDTQGWHNSIMYPYIRKNICKYDLKLETVKDLFIPQFSSWFGLANGKLSVKYTGSKDETLPHSRIMTIVYDLNGEEKTTNLIWDKGMDILNYEEAYPKNIKVFSDDSFYGQPERYAFYFATYIIRLDGDIEL